MIYCDMKRNSIKTETYGLKLKSQKAPPPINEFAAFANDLIELVKNIEFRTVHNQLQGTLIYIYIYIYYIIYVYYIIYILYIYLLYYIIYIYSILHVLTFPS